MGLRTVDQYLDGLGDDREVYYQGERVDKVVEHPELGIAVRHAAIDFALAHDPQHASLAVRGEPGSEYSAYFHLPETPQDLLDRSRLIEVATTSGATLVLLIKEIGSDALFALHRVLARLGLAEGLERAQRFLELCRSNDLALAVAQTDAKGDRSKKPSEQPDPDLYLRVVDRQEDGLVVRGAKLHTSCTPYVDEIIVLPSRSMRPGDEDWSIGFAIPAATPGVKMLASNYLEAPQDPFTQPVSAGHKMIETLTVFDDVFVPWERVFFDRHVEAASQAALTFVEYHRFTAVSYKLPLLDAFVGAAIAVSEANGISKAGHVRDKLAWLLGYAETVRGLTQLAAQRAHSEQGIAYPDVMTTNLAKLTFARDFHRALELLQDLAGGLLVTGPSGADWESPELGPLLRKYLVGASPAEERVRLINLVSDLTTRLYGGYQAVLAVHAEGSIEAEKLQMLRAYDAEPALALARRLAGIESG